jgi:RNA polymerase sigma-70 factor (ECF subfamily)
MTQVPTTRWSIVLATRGEGASAREALAQLCTAYRPVLLSHFRRVEPAQAEELTQSFFLHFLEQQLSTRAEPARGSFRAFVFTAAENHRKGLHRQAAAAKRQAAIADDGAAVERVADDDADPQAHFDRDWALLVIARARLRLRGEAERAGKAALFDELQPFLLEAPEPADYARVGASLRMPANSVAVAVKRLRERLRTQVRHELSETLAPGADLDAEVEWLKRALRRD